MLELNRKTVRNLLIVVVTGIVLYWVLHETERMKAAFQVIMGTLSPFVTGAAIAFVFNVPMRAFEGLLKGVRNPQLRRVIAILLTLIAVAVVLTGVFLLLVPELINAIRSLIPMLYSFVEDIRSGGQKVMEDYPAIAQWILEKTDTGNKIDVTKLAQQTIDTLTKSISGIFGALMDFVIAFVFAIYGLFQKETLARQGRKLLYAFLPEKRADSIVRILRLTNSTFSNFLSGQCVEVCILGSLFAVTMAIFNMPFIPLISVLIAITAFVPVVGAFVGCAIGAFLILVSNPIQAVWFVIMFLILQQIENNLIYPKVVGSSVGLSGMWVLLAVSVGGELLGVAGMFLMIPVASVLYTLLREHTAKRLEEQQVDPEKLKIQPPELRSKFKEKREKNKEARIMKKLEKETENTEEKS